MARFMVKASEFKNVCKAVNDRKLAELKKEIIEILKKQDEKDVKKAIDYFNSQEKHYTHLEKSLISGKWIQKAGYGVGTVRIWKGKKYKKIAPGKWARVFDKEGRGTNIAIGKLIARVQKIDNVEDLMAFVMQNKQRFVDENGIDLPVLDKLRAAVDAKNNGDMGSKTTSKPAEKTDGKYDKELVDSWKDDYKNFSADALKEKIEEYTKVLKRAKNDNPSPDQRVAVKQNEHRLKALNELLEEKKNKPAEKKEKPVTSKFKAFEEVELNFPGEGRVKGKILEDLGDDYYKVQSSKTGYTTNVFGKDLKKMEVEKGKTQEDYEKEYEQSLKGKNDAETLDNIVEAYDKVAKRLRPEAKAKGMNPNELNDPELEALGKLRLIYSEKNISEGEKKYREELEKLSGRMKDAINNEFGYEEESEADKPSKKEEKQYKETKKMLEDKIAEFDKQLKMFDNNPNENTKRLSKDVEKQKKTYVKMLENLESEYEKTQNRSEAMKGNQNAKKLFTSEDGAEDYFKTIVSPFEFNIGEAKVRMEIREKTNLPPDVSQIPFDLVVVRDNGSTVVSHPKSYDDAYDEILETIRGENSSLSTEWPDMNGKFVRLHNRYAMDSLKALPKEDKYGNKVDDFIDEEIKNKAGSFKKNTKELQNELMSLSKQRNENLDEIKRLNADLAKINQDKYNDEARGNPTTEYDKKIKEINNKIDNLLDGNADIEKRGNDIVKELDKLEKEPEKKNEPKALKTSSVNLGVTADGKDIKITKSTDAKKKIGIAKATLEDNKFIVPATKELDDTIKAMEKFFKDVDANNRIMLKGFGVVDGFLCATDGRQAVRIKIDGLDNSVGDCVKIRKEGNNYIIEQDDLTTTWEEETDDWSRGYKQMKKVTRTADRKTQKYPNVSRVIPDNATETMDLDTAALKDVIKQLKKEKFLSASTVRSDANHYLPVIIKDGNITIDGKTIGTIPDKEIDKEMAWDFRFVENALNMGANSFNYSPEKMKDAPYMPLVASTNIGDTVFMSAEPMAKMSYYDKDSDKIVEQDKLSQHREEMARQKEKDESKRNAMYSTNKDYVDVIIESVKRSIKPDFSEKMIEKIRNMNVSDLKNLYNQAKVDIDDLMGKKDFYANTFSSYTNKHYDVSPKVLIAQNYALKQYPELVTEIEKQLEAKGEKVKKSLFDDFIVDMFVEEDEEEEPEEENESLFNDYSAEQPELFNSTEMKVQEAFNRCNCCL